MSEVPILVQGRYALSSEIAAGGMATVHLGRLLGPVGFSRTVAIKRLHPQYAKDPDFVSMFLDEARLAARVQHPNVVPTLDVVAQRGELFLVMEYVEGESLARLLRIARAKRSIIPPRIVGSIMSGALFGLHAAHEATNEAGERLGIVHRDVSPQNVLVGVDGSPRVLDFGVAKAAGRVQTTREGQVKGKLAYMPAEQFLGEEIDRRVDIYAAGVVTWEALTCRRLFDGENEGAILEKILRSEIPPPSLYAPGISHDVDRVVMRALSRDKNARFATAWEMGVAIEETLGTETARHVGAFVEAYAHEALLQRAARVKQLETMPTLVEGLAHGSVQASVDLYERGTATTMRIRQERAKRNALFAIGAVLGLGVLSSGTIFVLKTAARSSSAPASSGVTTPANPTPPSPTSKQRISESGPASSSEAAAISTSAEPQTSVATQSPTSKTPTTTLGPKPQATQAVTNKTTANSTATAAPTPQTTAAATASTKARAKPGCEQPYFVEGGIRKIRRECVR